MMHSLREIAMIFIADPSEVTRTVTENLRFLDLNIVLSLVYARSDAKSNITSSVHWSRQLSAIYPMYKSNDIVLPWEDKKRASLATIATMATIANRTSIANRSSIDTEGPLTLKKFAVPLTALEKEELLHNNAEGIEVCKGV